MAIESIKLLVEITFPVKTYRIWDGSGPFLDPDGELWIGAQLAGGIDEIETALNGEASSLDLWLAGTESWVTDLAYEDLEAGTVIGSRVRLMIQDCGQHDQPIGSPQVRFTGEIVDLRTEEVATDTGATHTVVATVANRFMMLGLASGAVLSDVDQKARSALRNPNAPLDRFCERIPLLINKTIVWPRFG